MKQQEQFGLEGGWNPAGIRLAKSLRAVNAK
jgi:hypothetical protein